MHSNWYQRRFFLWGRPLLWLVPASFLSVSPSRDMNHRVRRWTYRHLSSFYPVNVSGLISTYTPSPYKSVLKNKFLFLPIVCVILTKFSLLFLTLITFINIKYFLVVIDTNIAATSFMSNSKYKFLIMLTFLFLTNH